MDTCSAKMQPVIEAMQARLNELTAASDDPEAIKMIAQYMLSSATLLLEFVARTQALDTITQSSKLPPVGSKGVILTYDPVVWSEVTSSFTVVSVDDILPSSPKVTVNRDFSSWTTNSLPLPMVFQYHNGHWVPTNVLDSTASPQLLRSHIAVFFDHGSNSDTTTSPSSNVPEQQCYWQAINHFRVKKGIVF